MRRIETAYNKQGGVERITSFDSATAGSGNVVNEVVVLYNGFGQAIETFQSHAGAVNLSTTPSVQMAYADGSANTIRPTGITYPDGRKITYDYGAADSIHDQCSLVASLIDSDMGATHLADYQYLGLGIVVLQDSPQADLRYTLVSLTGSNDPDTGDIYAGLDRFGRVKDLRWRNTDTSSDLSRVLSGYDRASSRIWRENPSDSSRRYDWLYGYDGLHRLHSAERGELNSGHTSITSPQFGQCWTLDPTGNWHGFRQDDDGNSTWDLIQARTSNPVNEITDIDNTTGSSWATPSYDAGGNMTTIPRPDLGTDRAMTATWDAWNRLAKLVDPDTSDTLAEYSYDGRNFRIVGKSFAGGTLDETRHYYFTDSWQCLEERIDSSTDPERQHVWGIRYIDDLILRDRDTTGNGTLDERLYFLPDANWNVTAAVDDSGAVQERIEYTPYGWPHFLSPTFSSRTGSSFDVRYTYTSREWEADVGLYYFRNRWYVPMLGVFCSRDPIGYFDYESLYYVGFAVKRTDPYGLSDFIHPGDIDSLDGCDQWEQDRIADCYKLLGWFVNRAFLDCIAAVRDAANKCRDRNVDNALRGLLDGNCCDSLPTKQEREACYDEASRVMTAIQKARDDIYRLGGPSRLSFQGPVCTTCQDIVNDELKKAATKYFIYETQAATAGLPVGIPGLDHCWGQLYCKSAGENRYGKVLVTIDFWIGERNYWREGEGGFGW